MKNIKVVVGELEVSKGKHSNLEQQFIFRTSGKFVGESQIVITDTKEAVWWNRPLQSKEMVKLEDDGLYSYNLPFLGDRDTYKTGYNLLLNKNSITYTSHIKFDNSWTDEQKQEIYNLSYDVLYEALIELGVDKKKLLQQRNDMLYDGKKFAGSEKIIRNDVFTENLVITMEYLPEKEIFSRLTGKYATVRGITGIAEENSNVKKDVLIDKMYNKLIEKLATLN